MGDDVPGCTKKTLIGFVVVAVLDCQSSLVLYEFSTNCQVKPLANTLRSHSDGIFLGKLKIKSTLDIVIASHPAAPGSNLGCGVPMMV